MIKTIIIFFILFVILWLLKNKLPLILVLAWNFFDDIKKNNKGLSKNFINIKSLEKES